MLARSVALIALLAAAASCATTRPVRPLGRSNAAFSASIGGPLVQVSGLDVGAPLLVVGEAYGTRDDLDVFLNADVTAGVYGDLHLEPGLAYHPLVREGGAVPTLTAAGSAHVVTDFSALRVYPELALTAAWLVHHRHVVYLGGDGALGFGANTRLLAGPLVGGQLRAGRVGLTLEGKWMAPYYDVAPTAPTWISPWSRGYVSVLIGVAFYTEAAP